MKKIITAILLGFSQASLADLPRVDVYADSGEQLSVRLLKTGEVWASFYLSDNTLSQFNPYELIVVQVDDAKPFKLVQGLRSCGAPAGKAQQIDYQFESKQDMWSFAGSKAPRQDVLKLLGWDDAQYHTIKADRRNIVVDFPVNMLLAEHLQQGLHIHFLYTTDEGVQHDTNFSLHAHKAHLQSVFTAQ